MYKTITTIAAAIAAVLPDPKRDERDQKRKEVEDQLTKVVDAINGPDFVADWNNTKQRKYVIVWEIVNKPGRVSGRGLSLRAVLCAATRAYVGPRLVFENEEKALHCAEHFLPLWESYYLG